MSPQEARALGMAYELQGVLGELAKLPEHGEGSRVAEARNYMDDVTELLDINPEISCPPVDHNGRSPRGAALLSETLSCMSVPWSGLTASSVI